MQVERLGTGQRGSGRRGRAERPPAHQPQRVDIEGDVVIGHHVSLQSGCYITRGVVIEDEVFCGPRVITMNDKRISHRRPGLTFVREGPRIERAARVVGGSVLLPGVTIGANALVGAGSVVTRDVPAGAIVVDDPTRIVGTVLSEELS